MNQEYFEELIEFLERLPAIDLPAGRKSIGTGKFENGNWWVKFKLNLSHPFAWRHVQELGHVLNHFLLKIHYQLFLNQFHHRHI